MITWPNQSPTAMNAYYGCPDKNGDGRPDPIWETINITKIVPPYEMALAWNPAQPVSVIHVNRACAPSLSRILQRIKEHYGSQDEIEKARLHLYGGAYMFRLMRGANRLSVHSWGAAIDLDPGNNPFGGKVTMDPAVVALFAQEGWVWGGKWRTPDGMHFQAATL